MLSWPFVASLVLLSGLDLAAAKRRPAGLLKSPGRLVIDVSSIKACSAVPDNAIRYYDVTKSMASKVDSAISAKFNITRAVPKIEMVLIRLTKCREVVSSNTCEHFQTWRFDKEACAAFSDPKAVWGFVQDTMKPRLACPSKPGRYSFSNVTLGSTLLQAVPLPWEGNVWLVRFGMMETKTKFHHCSDVELHAQRVPSLLRGNTGQTLMYE